MSGHGVRRRVMGYTWFTRLGGGVGMLAVLLAAGCTGRDAVQRPAAPLSMESLLARMTNLVTLAERPLGESFLASSYDRRGGNMDWSVWTKAEPSGRIALLDVDGPGYVSRIWVASMSAKRWLFFFDGESSPRLTLTPRQLFGDDRTFPFASPLSGESGGGRYCLMPIPFVGHLRIEIEPERLDPANRNYFQINYTIVPAAAEQTSWPVTLSAAQSNAVVAACAALDADRGDLERLAGQCLTSVETVDIAPGASTLLVSARGSGQVDGFAVRIVAPDPAAQVTGEVLRNLRLRAWWDRARAPSVDVPLGDFFCNPFHTRRFAAYALGRVGDAYVCRLPMPYARHARMVIENRGRVPVRLAVGARTVPLPADRAGRRYFHANWRASTTSGAYFDMIDDQGPGHYVGCFLTAIGQDGSWNILEGDEHLLPDAGVQPGQYGTGLEDYFSGAYYYTSLFDLPWHGLIEKGAMRTDQYRFHALDAVDFATSFKGRFEFGDQNRAQGYMSSVVYWYADRPRDCTLPDLVAPLLARPSDRFELPGFMAMLFTLEREGLWDEAGVRCDALATRHAQQPWADLLRVRAAAYRERMHGIDAVRGDLERLSRSPFAPAARQAGDLLWRHEADTHALLGMHMWGRFVVSIDGMKVAEGHSRAILDVRRLDVQPGRHVWEVDFTPTMQGSFLSLCLRTRWGDITSAGPWEIVEVDPLPGTDAPKAFAGGEVLPNMTVWQFEPNGHIDMQSGAQCMSLWAFFAGKPNVKRLRVRQAWTNGPAAAAVSPATTVVPERSEAELRAHAID